MQPLTSKPYNDLLLRTEKYALQVRKLFGASANSILSQIPTSLLKLNDDEAFSFDDNKKLQEMIQTELRRLHAAVYTAVRNGVEIEWETANTLADELLANNFTKVALQSPYFRGMLARNMDAMEAFLQRKENGLDLSERVWKTTEQLRDEMELSLSVSIGEGESASTISRRVRQYLNEPDKLFRRVRGEDGKLRLSKAAQAYHPGQGVYRSSARNAMRLARTETNIAYRRADNERWQQMTFVLGQEINLSRSHPKTDICDTLAGRYPKDFLFDGWHPQCFCYAVPILASKEDFVKMQKAALEDKEYDLSDKQIRDVPDNFKSWLGENQERISNAANLPYFLRNNGSFDDDGIFVLKEFMPLAQSKEMTSKQIADLRHANRTEAEIADIKQRWAERQHKHEVIRKAANNVLKVAQDYGEVDYSALQEIINANNLNRMQEATRALAQQILAMRKEEQALSALIPDVHTWHKQFTIEELKQVYSAVEKKLQYISTLPLELQAKKLNFEIQYIANPSAYKAGAIQHITWQVAQSSYKLLLNRVEYSIAIDKVNAKLATIEKWCATSKSKKVPLLLNEAKEAIVNGADIKTIEAKTASAEAEYQKRLAEQTRRDKKKGINQTFTQERKDAAIWDKGDGKLADDTLIDTAAQAWKSATKKEKDRIYEYTHHFCDKNEPLQKRTYFGHQTRKDFEDKINAITKYINRNELPCDMWFMRGDDSLDVIQSRIEFAGGTMPNDLQDLVGMTMQEGGFMSCGSRKGKGFASRRVIINVFAPKGTKAAYIEPISYYGNGAGRKWDGDERFTSFSSEHETLFQRGTKMRITKVYQQGAKIYIDVEIVGQETLDLSYVQDSWIGY